MSKTTFSDVLSNELTIESSGIPRAHYRITIDPAVIDAKCILELNEYQAKILINALRNLIESDS
jgi:hypothetical protein